MVRLNSKELLGAIAEVVGEEYVSDDDFIRHAYSKNVDATFPYRWPDLVVRPESTDEIQEIVRIANRFKTPIIPRGAGCDLSGGAKPIEEGGIVLDLTRMNKVVDLDEEAMLVTAECGITWGELNAFLMKKGFYTGTMGPGSGMAATIGGGLSNNSAGGGGAFKYGPCTEQCVGLEVVLPKGNVIKTGSAASVFVKKPFARYVAGPDLTGLFLGDNGIMGIKSKATLRVFQKEEHVDYKTFYMDGLESVENATKIIMKVQKEGGLGCWDLYFMPLVTVDTMKRYEIHKHWDVIPEAAAVIFYVTVANSGRELEANVESLDTIFNDQGAVALGPEVEDGNWAKFHLENQGHWQFFHLTWGLLGSGSMATASCHMIRTEDLPKWDQLFEEWYGKRVEWFEDAGAAGSYTVFTLPNHLDFVSGFTMINKPEYWERNRRLWLDWIKTYIRNGGVNYWLGEAISRAYIEVGAFPGPYYDLLKSIKHTLDPNGIISPGKFYL